MDAVILDGLIAEIRPRLLGRHLGRARLGLSAALSLEVSAERGSRLWLDAGRSTAGLCLLEKPRAKTLEGLAGEEASGRARQALLHVRKHLDGARVRDLRRVTGTRIVVLEAGDGALVLALGALPALGVVAAGALLGVIGDGLVPWPVPESEPAREWDQVDAEAVAAAVRSASAEGQSPVRAVLEVCPGLSPPLARRLDGHAATFEGLRAELRQPRPIVSAPGPVATWHDADLAGPAALSLWSVSPPVSMGRTTIATASFNEGAALVLEGRARGRAFEVAHRRAVEAGGKELRRLVQLESHLERDAAGLPDEGALRLDAEALLAHAAPLPPGILEVEIPDPRDPSRTRRVRVDPVRGGPRSADLLFAKARRIERARRQIEERLAETRAGLALARTREGTLRALRDLPALAATPVRADKPRGVSPATGPRHYLTSRGLSILVGRGARENHHLTFTVAGPDDLWLHARDVPGAHVILKDPQGRAGPDDQREAAETAAFFSDAASAAKADVHVTRRKHVRAARGGPGRVILGHTETLRVIPRDPEGLLRRRP